MLNPHAFLHPLMVCISIISAHPGAPAGCHLISFGTGVCLPLDSASQDAAAHAFEFYFSRLPLIVCVWVVLCFRWMNVGRICLPGAGEHQCIVCAMTAT